MRMPWVLNHLAATDIRPSDVSLLADVSLLHLAQLGGITLLSDCSIAIHANGSDRSVVICSVVKSNSRRIGHRGPFQCLDIGEGGI